jgi:hypothetical protein
MHVDLAMMPCLRSRPESPKDGCPGLGETAGAKQVRILDAL